jgi:predicted RNA-binding Zn ribbon-like protein
MIFDGYNRSEQKWWRNSMVKGKRMVGESNLETETLCLDFANTAEWHASEHVEEKLNNYNDLICWASRVGVLTDREARYLSREAARRPADATAVLEQAVALREAIYRVFSAVAKVRSPKTDDLRLLNGAMPRALARLQIIRATDGFAWGWTGEESELDRMLWPVMLSVANLLTSDKLDRVGQCADDRGCGWLFLDMSRNRSRRWCDMKDCGNRAKVKRHYRRRFKTDKVSTD